MNIDQLRPTDQLFSHFDPDEKVWRHFNSSAIARDITNGTIKPPKFLVDLPDDLAAHLMANGGIETYGLERAKTRAHIPIIVAVFDKGETLIIDGNHRAVYRYSIGLKDVMAYVLPESMWTPYVLRDLPTEVEAMLIAGLQGLSA